MFADDGGAAVARLMRRAEVVASLERAQVYTTFLCEYLKNTKGAAWGAYANGDAPRSATFHRFFGGFSI